MSCPSCDAYMGQKQKVCGDCGWTKGQQISGIGCPECHLANPSLRRYHWLSIPAADLSGHLSWVADNITRTTLISELQETRKRYSGKVTASGRPIGPCDAWRETMIAAQADREIGDYTQHHIRTHGLYRREGEGAKEFAKRCLDSANLKRVDSPTAKQVMDYGLMDMFR